MPEDQTDKFAMKTIAKLSDTLSLCQRGPIYYARARLGAGRYSWGSLNIATTDADARRKAEQAAFVFSGKMGMMAQSSVPAKGNTFGMVIKRYLEFRSDDNKHGKASSNPRGHTSDLLLKKISRAAGLLDEYAGSKPVRDITSAVLQNYAPWRRAYYRGALPKNARRHPADTTIKWESTLAKGILIWATGQGYLDEANLPRRNFKCKQRNARPAFSAAEFYSLWQAVDKWVESCQDPRHVHTREMLRDYIHILANSGMRVGEANNLRLADVSQTIDSQGLRVYRLAARGKTGKREVILRSNASIYIERTIERRQGAAPQGFLFCMADERQITTLADQFDKVLEIAKMKTNAHGQNYCLYSLRHYYACDALRRNVSPYVLAKNMGTSVAMIEQYYGKSATAETLSKILAD